MQQTLLHGSLPCALGSRWLPSWNTQRPSTSLAPLGLSSLWRFSFLIVGTSSSFIDCFSWFCTHLLPPSAYTSSEAIAFTHIYAGGFRLKSHDPPVPPAQKKFSPESPSSTSRSTCWVFYEAFPVGSLTEMEKKKHIKWNLSHPSKSPCLLFCVGELNVCF